MLAEFNPARTRLFGSARLGFREVDWAEVVADARRYASAMGLKLQDFADIDQTERNTAN